MDKIETDQRRKNIVIFGAENTADANQYVESLLVEKLQLRDSIVDTIEKAFFIGKSEIRRPIVVQFFSEKFKREVMAKSHLLKNSKISLSNDLTPEQRKQRNVFVAAQKEAKKLGVVAKVRHNGLIIDHWG
jgi:hypothetical protein